MTPEQIRMFCCNVIRDYLHIYRDMEVTEKYRHYLCGRITGFGRACYLCGVPLGELKIVQETFDYIMRDKYDASRA